MLDFRGSFGERIRARREELGLSQEQLAERAGLHWTYISGIERGVRNPGLITIANIGAALGWALPEMFDGVSGTKKRERFRHPMRKNR